MPRIAVDMDEVIADALAGQLQWLNEKFDSAHRAEALPGTKLQTLLPAKQWMELQNWLHQGTFFRDLKPISGAQSALQVLSTRYEIFITTAAMEYPKSFSFKFEWIRTHFPFVDPLRIVFCGDKSILRADFLIDDNVRHFADFRGEGILYSAPHNRLERGFRRVENWSEVETFFMT